VIACLTYEYEAVDSMQRDRLSMLGDLTWLNLKWGAFTVISMVVG
jgi:hypothetical protein